MSDPVLPWQANEMFGTNNKLKPTNNSKKGLAKLIAFARQNVNLVYGLQAGAGLIQNTLMPKSIIGVLGRLSIGFMVIMYHKLSDRKIHGETNPHIQEKFKQQIIKTKKLLEENNFKDVLANNMPEINNLFKNILRRPAELAGEEDLERLIQLNKFLRENNNKTEDELEQELSREDMPGFVQNMLDLYKNAKVARKLPSPFSTRPA